MGGANSHTFTLFQRARRAPPNAETRFGPKQTPSAPWSARRRADADPLPFVMIKNPPPNPASPRHGAGTHGKPAHHGDSGLSAPASGPVGGFSAARRCWTAVCGGGQMRGGGGGVQMDVPGQADPAGSGSTVGMTTPFPPATVG